MSQIDDFLGSSDSSGNSIDNFLSSSPKEKATATDYLKGFGAGSNQLVSGLGALADYAGAQDIGKSLREAGDTGQKYWTDSMTPAGQKAAQSQVFEDDPNSIIPKVSDNWGQAALMGAAQSAPSMVASAIPGGIAAGVLSKGAGMLAARGVGGALAPIAAGLASPVGGWATNATGQIAARVPSAVGMGAGEGIVSGAMNAAQTKSQIEGMPEEELLKHPDYAARSLQVGPAQARAEMADSASRDVLYKTALSTGGIGAITGGGALGLGYRNMKGIVQDGAIKSLLKGGGEEALQETLQSGPEQYIQNKAIKDYANPNQNLMEGVVSGALSGGAVGGLMGVAAGGAGHVISPKQTIGTLPETRVVQDPTTGASVEVNKDSGPLSKALDTVAAPVQGVSTAVADNEASHLSEGGGTPGVDFPIGNTNESTIPQWIPNEFSDLIDSEAKDLSSRKEDILNKQAVKRVSDLETADARVADQRDKETAQKRGALLDSVLENLPEGQNPARAFGKALKTEGYADTFFRPEESARIESWKNISKTPPAPEPLPSTPNEMNAESMGIKEKKVKTDNQQRTGQQNEPKAPQAVKAKAQRQEQQPTDIVQSEHIAGAGKKVGEDPAESIPAYSKGLATMRAAKQTREGAPTEVYLHPVAKGKYALRPIITNAESTPASASKPIQGATNGQEKTAQEVLKPDGTISAEKERIAEIVRRLQNRNRSSAASAAQMAKIASNPDPDLLMASPTMSDGAPVASDLYGSGIVPESQQGKTTNVSTAKRKIPMRYAVVEASSISASNHADGARDDTYATDPGKLVAVNNGRTAGILEAYRRGTAGQYRAAIESGQDTHGIPKEVIASMESPVLVRLISPEHVTENIGDESNAGMTLGLSATEQARNDAGRLDMARIEYDEDGHPLPQSVRMFITAMPESEQQTLAPNGEPTKQAIDRLTAATFHAAYENSELVGLMAEATDPDAVNILRAMSKAAASMAKLKDAGNLDIRSVVVGAAMKVVNAARSGVSMKRFLAQGDMFDTTAEKRLADMFASNSRSIKKTAEKLVQAADFAYAESIRDTADMFGGTIPRASREDVLKGLSRDTTSTEDLGQQGGRRPDDGNDGRRINDAGNAGDAGQNQVNQPRQDYDTGDLLASYSKQDLEEQQARIDAADKEAAKLEADLKKKAKADALLNRPVGVAKNPKSVQYDIFNGNLSLFSRAMKYGTETRTLDLFTSQLPARSGEDTAASRADRLGLAAGALLRGAKGSLLGLAISTDWIRGRGSDLIGKRVTSAADLATLGAVLRDPRTETFRYFLMKGDKVVYHTAVSSRMEGSTDAYVGRPEAFLLSLSDTMERLGADGYYLMHNHPSRLVEASESDLRSTGNIADRLPGFRGHVILDHVEFGLIGADSSGVMSDQGAYPLKVKGQDPTRTTRYPHAALDAPVSSPAALAALAHQVRSPNNVILVSADWQNHITGLMEVSAEDMKQGTLTAIKNMMRLRKATGSNTMFAVLPKGMALSELSKAITGKGLLLDASSIGIRYGENGAQEISESAAEKGMLTGRRPLGRDKTGVVDQPRQSYGTGDLFASMQAAEREEIAAAQRKNSPQMDMFAALDRAQNGLPSILKSEPTSTTPVAESQATAPKVGDGKVATTQAGEAYEIKAYPKGQATMLASSMTKKGLPSEIYPHPTIEGQYAIRAPGETSPQQAAPTSAEWNAALTSAEAQWGKYDRGQRSMWATQIGYGNAQFGSKKQSITTMEWGELPTNVQRDLGKAMLGKTTEKPQSELAPAATKVQAIEIKNAGVVGQDPVVSGNLRLDSSVDSSPPPSVNQRLDQMIAAVKGSENSGSESIGSQNQKKNPASLLHVRAIQSVVDKFKAQFKGASALDINVVGSVNDIPAHYRPSPYAEGVYHADSGSIYMVADNLRKGGMTDKARALQTLLHEAIGHYGLASMMGDRFNGILKAVMKVASDPSVKEDIYNPGDKGYATVEAVRLRYPEASDKEVAQEVMARMAETEASKFQMLRAMIRQWVRDTARALGIKLEVTDTELNDLVAKASAYMREGKNLADHSEGMRGMVSGAMASESNPDFLESRARDWYNDNAPTSVKSVVSNAFDNPTSTSWLTPFNTQYHKAKKWAAEGKVRFKKVFDLAQSFLGDTSRFAVMAQNAAPAMFHEIRSLEDAKTSLKAVRSWGDFTGKTHDKDIAAIANPLYEGTLYGGGSPLSGVIFSDAKLRDDYKLTDRQIKLYHEALAAVNVSMDEMAKSIIAKHAKNNEVSFDRDMSIDDMAADVVIQLEDKKQEAIESVGSTAEEEVNAQIADLKEMDEPEQADKLKREFDKAKKNAASTIERLDKTIEDVSGTVEKNASLQEHGYFPLMRFGDNTVTAKDAEGKMQFFGMYEGSSMIPGSGKYQANKVAAEIKKEHPEWTVNVGKMNTEKYKLYSGMNLEAVQLFADHMDAESLEPFQEFLRQATNNRSVQKRMIHREGTPGFDRDTRRTLAQFIVSNARHTSSNYNLFDMRKAAEDADQDGGEIGKEAVKLFKYVSEPEEEAHALRGFLFFNFLGGSIASAMVNMSQVPMMTFPFLNQYEKAASLGRRLAVAAKMAIVDPQKITGALGDALRRAELDGVTAPQEIHLLMATAMNRAFSGNRAAGLFMRTWGAPFALAEAFNRKTTFIAAYQIAEGMSKDELDKTGFDTPFDFAENAVNETQGIYNKGNKMNVGRGAVGGTLMTFKQFSVMYLELLKRLPLKQQALMVGLMLLAAGGGGLPFAEDIEDIIDTIGQWMGYATNSKKSIRNSLSDVLGKQGADIAINGILSQLGADLHSRFGMQNLVPGTGVLKESIINKGQDIQEFFGPAASVIASIGTAIQSLATGKTKEAALAVAPNAIRNAVQGGKMIATGYGEDAQGRRTIPVNTAEGAIKMIGFNPKSIADYGSIKRDIAQDQRMVQVKREEFMSDMVQARLSGDTEAFKQAMQDMMQWNRDNVPAMRVVVDQNAVARRVQQARMEGAQRFLKTVSKPMRSSAREELRQ